MILKRRSVKLDYFFQLIILHSTNLFLQTFSDVDVHLNFL
jgi:hypothetical protein